MANNAITIRPINTKKGRNQFIKFAYKIYENDPNWVAPLLIDIKKRLDPTKDPFYEHASIQLFMAYINNEAVGRIAAIENRLYNETQNENTGFFGFFECIDNQEVANALFDAAKTWATNKGFSILHGPANPSINHEYGLLIDGFNDPPRLQMTFNPPYYQALIENYGFEKTEGLIAYKIDTQQVYNNEKFLRVANIARKRSGIKIRKINMKKLNEEVRLVKNIYNQAWEPNYGFVPMTNAEIDAMAEELKLLVNDELVIFGEIDDEPIGFALVMPDYNYIFKQMKGRLFPFNFLKLFTQRKKIEWARIIILGIIPTCQKRGLDAVFYHEIVERTRKHGIKYGEASWILESNLGMTRAAEKVLGGVPYKRYNVYEKKWA